MGRRTTRREGYRWSQGTRKRIEEVYLKAYAGVLEAQRGLEDYFRFYNGLRPHQALGHRTPAEVFLGEEGVLAEGESNGRTVHRKRGPNHWQESRDSHLTQPQFCPNYGVHLRLSGTPPRTSPCATAARRRCCPRTAPSRLLATMDRDAHKHPAVAGLPDISRSVFDDVADKFLTPGDSAAKRRVSKAAMSNKTAQNR